MFILEYNRASETDMEVSSDDDEECDLHTSSRFNLVYQMDMSNTSRNSILACWISDQNVDDVKSITLSKMRLKSITNVLDNCSDWALKAKKNVKWLEKQKYQTRKVKDKKIQQLLLKKRVAKLFDKND